VATGWPSSQEVESEISAWFDARTAEEEKIVARRLNKVALEYVVCAPLGSYLSHHAWRKSVTGVAQGPLPFFWGVSKTV
jgi:peptide/nickel transport system substrate-binding protein